MYSDDYNNEEVNQEYSEDNNQSGGQSSNQNKTKLWIVLAGIVLVIILIIFLVMKNGSNNNPPPPATPNLFISSQKENLSINNNIQLSATVTNFQNAVLTWTSSNPEVATVDQNGLVKGIGYGTTIITATYLHTDGVPYPVSCEVIVAEGDPNVSISNVRFQEGEIMISVGSEYDLPVIIEPSDGYITSVSYTSSDNNIVTVDNQGRIKAIGRGKATISLDFNNGQYKDDINVNVINESVFTQVFIPVTSIEFTNKLLKLEVGDIEQLNYQILPQEALTSNLKWDSSNKDVATVSNGIITAIAPGTTDITLTSLDGVSGIMTIEVVDSTVYVTGITATPTTVDIKVEETSQIVANITPNDATDKTISYSSNNPSIASVDANGLVTANSKGTAIITLTANGIEEGTNQVTTTVTVNVTEKSASGGNTGGNAGENPSGGSISVTPSSVTVAPGNTTKISVTTSGAKVTRCYSNNTNVVSVLERNDNSCTIKGVSNGATKVTIVAGDRQAVINVEVSETTLTQISLSSSSWNAKIGENKTVTVTTTPSGASPTLTTVSDRPYVATASCSGKTCTIKANGVGNATITISPKDNQSLAKTVYVVVTDGSAGSSAYTCKDEYVTSCTAKGKTGDSEYVTCTVQSLYKSSWTWGCTFPVTTLSGTTGYFTTAAAAKSSCQAKLDSYKSSCILGFNSVCSEPTLVAGYKKTTCTKN